MIFRTTWRKIALVAGATILFSLAYYQAPLFTSNQHQYFLHGLAKVGTGLLAEDWLANTVDPTPVFSWLVTITERIHARGLFYVYFTILSGIYLYSLSSIVQAFIPSKRNLKRAILLFSGLIVLHSAGLRWLLLQVPGADFSYLFDGGVAGQRLLGQVLQPSVFGVFLLLSISLYLHKKYYEACLSAVLACSIHPTYLLSSAIIIVTYMVDLWFLESQKIKAIKVGALALLSVCPIVIYTLSSFGGGSGEVAERAREILVNIRIPHHAKVEEWFDASTVIKILLLGAAILVVQSKKARLLISLPLGISVILTILQYLTGNFMLALIFPWRLSTWLVPIASAILVGKMVNLLPLTSRTPVWYVTAAPGVIIALAVVSGVLQSWVNWREINLSSNRNLEMYVSEHRKSGDLYLIPAKMHDFRIEAGVPVYGDFYSIPYADQEVIAWYSRFLNTKHFYESGDCSLLPDLKVQGVTHVVLPVDFVETCPGLLNPVYKDDAYQLLAFY